MPADSPLRVAVAGLLALAAAMGIGRFAYTPILPAMIEALSWSKLDAGLVASANYLGYLTGDLAVGGRVFAAKPRAWLIVALATSVATTGAAAFFDELATLIAIRFLSGVGSAFVIICASTLVLDKLMTAQRGPLSSLHFAGVGTGITVSSLIIAGLTAVGADWRQMWIGCAMAALLASAISVRLLPASTTMAPPAARRSAAAGARSLALIAAAHGLFGFGYVITATFIVTIVRETPGVRSLEPWIWLMVGLATLPSIPLWEWLSRRIGLYRTYALACLVEAAGVAASVEWTSAAGLSAAAVLLGGTFLGITALGLICARNLSGGRPQWAIGATTASFGLGQMIGPTVAGVLSEISGSLRLASLAAAAALIVAAALALAAAPRRAG